MRKLFDVTHVRRDKSEVVIGTVQTEDQIKLIADAPDYLGTWISTTRKVLRYGAGELRVDVRMLPMRIEKHDIVVEHGLYICRMQIENGEGVGWLDVTAHGITAFNNRRSKELWFVKDFSQLAERVDKSVAYQCMTIFDGYLTQYTNEPVGMFVQEKLPARG